jgi:sigma-E factor negative regulatory protein RseA
MEKISQLMDGELEGQECGLHIRRLTQDNDLAQRWQTYHLVRDVLRGEAGTTSHLAERVRARLEAEPTVLAPRSRLSTGFARVALPIAATVAGVAVVGWLAFNNPEMSGTSSIAQQQQLPAEASLASAPAVAVPTSANALPIGEDNEYLLAHQEYSLATAIQGAASYVRTFSDRSADSQQ